MKPYAVNRGTVVFQGEKMKTYWLEGREGMPEFVLMSAYDI